MVLRKVSGNITFPRANLLNTHRAWIVKRGLIRPPKNLDSGFSHLVRTRTISASPFCCFRTRQHYHVFSPFCCFTVRSTDRRLTANWFFVALLLALPVARVCYLSQFYGLSFSRRASIARAAIGIVSTDRQTRESALLRLSLLPVT